MTDDAPVGDGGVPAAPSGSARLSGGPPAEVAVDIEVARRLLTEQHPGLMTGPLREVAEGWDNLIVRVGTEYAERIPRRAIAAELIRNEQRWLPELAPLPGIEVPVPVAVGTPTAYYPWPWSVVRWIEGEAADRVSLGPAQGARLAAALRVLHRPAPVEAPTSPFRGVPLVERLAVVEERLARLGLDALLPHWRRALESAAPTRRVWVHGDLHPRNVLVREGEIVAIIDWGDLTAGDAATDLACAWTLFDDAARRAFLEAYEPTAEQMARAAGWAVNLASALLESGDDPHVSMGRRIVERLAGTTGS